MNRRLVRRIAHARHLIVMKIRLLNDTRHHRNLTLQSEARRKCRTALKLRLDALRINGDTAVYYIVHLRYPDLIVCIDGHFHHTGYIREKTFMRSESLTTSFRKA